MTQLGKYQVIGLLGSGATADVYRALDTVLEREVALKVLKPSLVYDTTAYTRFLREARAAASLFHPNIATVLDTAEVEGRYFIAMRYIEGKSLDHILKEDGPLPYDEVMRLVKDVGSALQYAHGRGFLHRDIKPSNIIRSMLGEYFLTDFGLVRALMETGMSSHTGAILGTPTYIPPEIWLNQPVTPAVDQYALACVIYEAITGKILFNGDTPPAIMTAHVLKGYGSLEGLPDALKVPMQKALNRLAEERYPDIKIFIEALASAKAPAGEPSKIEVARKMVEAFKDTGQSVDESTLHQMTNKEEQPYHDVGSSDSQGEPDSINKTPLTTISTPKAPETENIRNHNYEPRTSPSIGSKLHDPEKSNIKDRTGIPETDDLNMGVWKKLKKWFDAVFISGAVLLPSPSGKRRTIYWPSMLYISLLSTAVLINTQGIWIFLYDVLGDLSAFNIFLILSVSGLFYGWVLVMILRESFKIPKPIFIILGWWLAWVVNYKVGMFLLSTTNWSVIGIKGLVGGLTLSLSLKKPYRLNWKDIIFITLSWGVGFFLTELIKYRPFGLSFGLIIRGVLEASFGGLITLAILHKARKRLIELPGGTDPSSPNFSSFATSYTSHWERKVDTRKILTPELLYIILASSSVMMMLSFRFLLGLR